MYVQIGACQMNKKYIYYIVLPIVILLTFLIVSSQVGTDTDTSGYFKARVSKEAGAKKNCGCAYQ